VSYRAARKRRGLGEVASGGISVGRAAFGNPILARASLDASNIILAMAKAGPAERASVLRRRLDALQPGLGPEVARRFHGNVQDRNQDQALFDAIRATLAERVYRRGLEVVRNQVGTKFGWDALLDTGLGDLSPNDRAIGCTIAGGAATAGSIAAVVPVWGTLVNAVTGVGSQVASSAMDCTREQREAQAALAAAQAAQAQAQLQAASAAVADAQRSRRKLLLTAGGIIGVTGLVWFLVT